MANSGANDADTATTIARGMRPSATIIPFPGIAFASNRLTPMDRAEVARWMERSGDLGFVRVDVHAREPGDPEEMGDILSLYRKDEGFAAWSLARVGRFVIAWRGAGVGVACRHGTLRAALAALAAAERGAVDPIAEADETPPVTDPALSAVAVRPDQWRHR